MIEVTPDITNIVSQIADLYRAALRDAGKVATGNLSNFTFDVQQDGKYFAIIFNLPDYWKYVENGRAAGKLPNIAAIERWITVKPIIPKAMSGGKVPSTKQLAFLISRSIAKNGIKPTKALQNTINSPNTQNLEDRLCDLIITQIENEINEEDI